MFAVRPDDFSVAVTWRMLVMLSWNRNVETDLEDTVDVNFEDDFESGFAGSHRRDWS